MPISARPTPVLPAVGRLDHPQGRAVLDAAARVQELQLRVERERGVLRVTVQPDQRRLADQLEYAVGDAQGARHLGHRRLHQARKV
jgi:hypothetical protein